MNMRFELYSDVILTRDIAELRRGDVGTVVERHAVPYLAEEGYVVLLARGVRLNTTTR